MRRRIRARHKEIHESVRRCRARRPRIICVPMLSEMKRKQNGRLALGLFTQRLPN
jgi:hypothetical protein